MNKQRRHFAGAEKVAILKRHLVDKVPISDLCDELGTPSRAAVSRSGTPPVTKRPKPNVPRRPERLLCLRHRAAVLPGG